MASLPNIISVDDHILEPANLWTDRLPAKYREIAPHVKREYVRGQAGDPAELSHAESASDAETRLADVWYYEDIRVPMMDFWGCVGMAAEKVENLGATFDDLRPGCWDPRHRLLDMDINGVDASLCFPNIFIRFCGQRFLFAKDRELALLSIKAYNDFLVEEWEANGDGRLFGAAIVPLWDAALAAKEVRRMADRGIRSVSFSEMPAWLELPGLYGGYWDPFFEACAETGLVVQMHIGSSSRMLTTSADAPFVVPAVNTYINASLSLADVLTSGLFVKFPKLEIAYAESQAGWIPYLLERLDMMWDKGYTFNRGRAQPELPSTYFKDHVYCCIYDDRVAVTRVLDMIGEDNICFETDYPHPDSTWPDSMAVASRLLDGLDESTRYKIVRGNPMRMLRLTEDDLRGLTAGGRSTGP